LDRIHSLLLAAALLLLVLPTHAQAPADVPQGHWAYDSIQNLAGKGLIKGYPPNGNVFGGRTATRYEIASIIHRIIQHVDETYARKTDSPPGEPPRRITQAQVDEVKRLVGEFQKELLVLGTDLKRHQARLDDIEIRLQGVKKTADQAAADAAAAAKESAAARSELKKLGDSFGATKKDVDRLSKDQRAHRVSGYFQGRLESLEPGGGALFPPGGGGTGQSPTLGAPSVGGQQYGFQMRRVRLRLSGPLTLRSDYSVQLDAQSVGAVSLMDAFVNLTDLPVKGSSVRLGQYSPPFGYELPTSSTTRESPERAYAFGTSATDYPIFKTTVSGTGGTVTPGSVLPLFLSQNRDVGAAVVVGAPAASRTGTRASLALINGEGRSSTGVRNQNRGLDLLGRAETGLFGGRLGLGVSGYYGALAVRGGPPTGTPATPVAFVSANRKLAGIDLRYTTPWRTTLRAEYLGGIFETTPDRAQYLANNHVYGWYFTARHPVSSRIEAVAKYDEFYPISEAGKTAGGLGRMELVRKSLAGGILYNFDEAIRFRLWYVKGLTPYDPSATSGPLRSRLGLLTGEVQVSY